MACEHEDLSSDPLTHVKPEEAVCIANPSFPMEAWKTETEESLKSVGKKACPRGWRNCSAHVLLVWKTSDQVPESTAVTHNHL